MDCPLEIIDGRWTCPDCGWVYLRLGTHRPPRHNCQKAPSRGLGDTIAKLTSAIGIKPCDGCKERQALLNRMVPYRQEKIDAD